MTQPEAAVTPPVEKKEEPPPAPAPPPGPKFVLGEAKIVMKADMSKEKVTAEIAIAADGAVKTTVTSSNKKTPKKTTNGKLTVDGELFDDKNEVIAKLADDGTLTARQVFEEKQDGKVVKSESKMEPVGKLADDGVFTNAKDGSKFSVDDKGKIAGLPADFTVTAKPEQKKAVMFVVIAMFAASKTSMDSAASSGPPAVAPVPTKK